MNAESKAAHTRHPLVLVAEEDDDLRRTLAEALERDGYRVVDVEDGLELLDYLELTELFPGKLERPALIVSNLELKGCGGIEACRLVAYHRPAPPFLLLAADADGAVRRDALNAGVVEVLGDPSATRELLDAVAQIIP